MNHTTSFHKGIRTEVIGVFVIALAGIGMAWLSWQKWTDPIIDFGRELYVPWLLCQGKDLYKDINIFFYGPFSYYLNALLFTIFGVHINTIIGFNLILISVIAVIIHKIVKTVSNSVCAFFSVLSFIVHGFFLVLPGFLIVLIIVLHILPALMKRITGDARFGMIPAIVLILFTLYSYFSHSVRQYNLIDYPIKSDHEVIKTFDLRYSDIGEIIQQAINKINIVVKPDETLTVFPEGLMFNYLTRRESASPYTAFLPTFFAVFGNDILESLQKKPPDFVLLVERSTWEYGYRYFGIDYATGVLQWIKENYIEISQIGKRPFSGEGFGIVIMKRISS